MDLRRGLERSVPERSSMRTLASRLRIPLSVSMLEVEVPLSVFPSPLLELLSQLSG